MNTPKSYIFVMVAGRAFGLGHFRRCKILGEGLKKKGIHIIYVVVGHEADKILLAGQDVHICTSILEVNSFLHQFVTHQTTLILDIIHPDVLIQYEKVGSLIHNARQHGLNIVAIDDMGKCSLRYMLPHLDIDLFIVPYVGNTPEMQGKNVLIGANYAILDAEYEITGRRLIRDNASKVLVTTGGSDNGGYTEIVLKAVEKVNRNLSVRVIIGPFFDEDYVAEMRKKRFACYQNVEFVFGRNSLYDDMYWSDVCLAASGTVKYELAATGTPTVLFSINKKHDDINKEFVTLSGQMDLGLLKDSIDVSLSLEKVLDRVSLRTKMSTMGQNLVDGKGVRRILNYLLNI